MAPLEIYVEPPVGETPADPERCVVQGFQQERVVSAGEEVKFKVMLLDSNGQPTDGSFPEIIFGTSSRPPLLQICPFAGISTRISS